MELFDKKFVHFMWEDELEGKEGFFEDCINDLIGNVNNCTCLGTVTKSENYDYPFLKKETGIRWMFFYYDPNYECKKAYAEGEQIQLFNPETGDWIDCDEPEWLDILKYRIKPEKPKTRLMNCRELSEWLAKGNGQWTNTYVSSNNFQYDTNKDKCEISPEYKIRRWGTDEWIEPTIDVYETDVKEK